MARLKITQHKSVIGEKPKTRATIQTLGLRKIGQTVFKEDLPQYRGMVHRVRHLVDVEEVE
ncbi:50S ribosomal protein L30 [Glycomyces harbinensis]|jgi:large subunit ribosomal protein L30|uniref:Large ribosomal subunit protein uL30 n=1 Tax=Glycomyces harbinensis TaxID=58114 RepID=A0A1G7D1V0_9ACTN|nr:50S ribosomal protein L30 [Glycomyces harbinensis]SDE45548.1 large subunit ribosomal protein L30 [Glycomyces harbinensis]